MPNASSKQAPLTVALVAGEASGDLLGAGLMKCLKARHANVRFIGVGGARMQAEGLKPYFPQERLAVMGLVEVLGRLPELIIRRHRLLRSLLAEKPDVFVGIDAPDFNLGVELKLKKAGMRTVHYVSPSVWAWRQERVFKIRQACDMVLALLPFEAQFYERYKVPVRFVGHPLADSIPQNPDRQLARSALGLGEHELVLALMPGSRASEIARLAPDFFEAAQRLHVLRPEVRFILPCVNAARRQQIERLLAKRELPVQLLDGHSHEALAACNAVLIASGTATLEAMLFKRPMVVAYRVSPISYRLAKRLVKTPYFSLPNLLAGRALVPELIQDAATPQAMVEQLLPLLADGRYQTEHFAALHEQLRRNASEQAAEAVLHIVGQV